MIVCFSDETAIELENAANCEVTGKDAVFRDASGFEIVRFNRLKVLAYGGDKLRAVYALLQQRRPQPSSL